MRQQRIFKWSGYGSSEEWSSSTFELPANGNPQVILYCRAASKTALADLLGTTPRMLTDLTEINPASMQYAEVEQALRSHEGAVLWRPLNWLPGGPFAVRQSSTAAQDRTGSPESMDL